MLTLQMPRLLCDVASDGRRFVELTVLLGEPGLGALLSALSGPESAPPS